MTLSANVVGRKRASHADEPTGPTKKARQDKETALATAAAAAAVPGSWRTPQEQAEVGPLVSSVTNQLVLVCQYNSSIAVDAKNCPDESIRMYYGTFIQPFSLFTYVQRLADHMRCSHSVFITSMVYLRRIQAKQPLLRLTDYTVHRLFITALVLATKFLEDQTYENSYYARVGGVELADLNAMEMKMLQILDFQIAVDLETYHAFEEGIMETFSDVSSASSISSDSELSTDGM